MSRSAFLSRAGSSPAIAPISRELTASPAHPQVIAKPMAVPLMRGKALPTMASVVGNTGAMDTPAMNTSTKATVGLLIGRVAVSRILLGVPEVEVTLASSVAMAVTTYLMLKTSKPTVAFVLVFIAGVSMAPVFPTTLAMVGNAFPRMSGTAIGFAITCGWAGLAVSSRLIGAIAGDDPARLKKALLLIPGAAVLMIGVNLVIWAGIV